MGLQISHSLYTGAAEETRFLSAAPTFGESISRIGVAQGIEEMWKGI
jgi:hypothetical protein